MSNLFQRAVLDGGIMMFFLIPCSVIALAYILQGLISLRRERLAPSRLVEVANSARSSHEIEATHRRLAADLSPLGRVVSELARLRPEGTERLERETDRLAGEETTMLYQRWVAPLALIRNVALYLGLLGTILGIMRAFGEFATGTEQSVELLGQGINQALVTTAWGLSIAIPSMIFVHIFRQRLITCERVTLPEIALAIHRRLIEGEKS
ncbi:MotA/TolQ/ExbB proton channel family protein [Candidatus Sumerlaeota bacterium]|nr:MotA/TolQ/ExbB proton channel family protein [Candidatus Sumerlaeota bacterium]